MTRPLNSDPLRNFRFLVAINHPSINLAKMGFMAVSGLSVQTEVIPYKEGGNNTTTRKMPGQSDFGPISFTRGMMAAPVNGGSIGTNEAYQWLTQIFSAQAGAGTASVATIGFRVGVNIDVLAHPITLGPSAAGVDNIPAIKARFQLFNAWPMGLSYSDLEAGGNAVIIENLTLAHEGWSLVMAGQGDTDYLPTNAGF